MHFLADGDYHRLAELIHARAGIKMPPSKKTFLEGRLRKRLPARGFAAFDEYCHWLFEENGLAEEETALLDAVTTNKTDFFREPHHFDHLTTEALPRLLSMGRGSEQPLRVWSAGCSNGAEPYTLAMVCQDFADRHPRFRFEIAASDLSTTMLSEAARAIYPHHAIEPVPMEMRKRYLLRDPLSDEVRIAPELRRLVSFFRINLMDSDYGLRQQQDIVFCRNLIIYFDKQTQRLVLERLCRMVRPGGYLVLGHSESITGLSLPLRPVAATFFLREGER
ncbi:MAG: CheR family methyltransferase [Actinomycetota bacterium]